MSVHKALGRAANQRGETNEIRVLNVLQTEQPAWMFSARAATEDEDSKGVDIVVDTDVGKLFLQVKSSRTGVAKHKSKRRASMIGVVRCHHRVSDAQLRVRTHGVLISLRKQVLTIRGQKK